MSLSLWSLWLAVAMLAGQGSTQVVHHFDGTASDTELRRMVIDDSSGEVYVGGVNTLYKLSATLESLAHVETGPRPDNLDCEPNPKDQCTSKRFDMDSVNQALVIVPWQRLVIACSTLYYGYCEKISLFNLTRMKPVYPYVVPNNRNASVVMLIRGSGDVADTSRLYVGATHSTIGFATHNNKVPMVSSRSVDTLALKYSEGKSSTSSYIDLLPQYLSEDFKVHFQAGFSHDSFIYFVVVRPKLVNGQAVYSSWLARVCHGDDNFQSYVEVPIECSTDNNNYTIAISAHLARPNQRFPRFSDVGNALFVSFSTMDGNSAKATANAAVCSYSMALVKLKFVQNVKECFSGKGNLGPAHLVFNQECTKTVRTMLLFFKHFILYSCCIIDHI